MRSRGEGKFGSYKVQHLPELKAITARNSSQTVKHDVKALLKRGFGQQNKSLIITHNNMIESATIQTKPDTKMCYSLNEVNFQGESTQPCHFEGPDKPHDSPKSELLSGKSLRLSTLYLPSILILYAMVASHYTKPNPIYAILFYSQQRARKFYVHIC